MKTLIRRPALWPLLLLAFVVTACENPTAVEDDAVSDDVELAVLAEVVAADLQAAPAQQQQMQAMMAGHLAQRGQPGHLWFIAADLQERLTDEQKARLFERALQAESRGGLSGPGGFHGPDGMRGPGGFMGAGGQGQGGVVTRGFLRVVQSLLTDDQQDAFDDLKTRFQASLQALREGLRDGTLTREAFFTELQALQEALQAEIDALLTDEQKEALREALAEIEAERDARREAQRDTLEARRAAERAAMAEALALTDDQVTALESLHTDQHAEREALVAQFRAGEIDQETFVAALQALKEANLAALESLLDDVQFEIVQIHDALRILRAQRMARHGGPGNRQGGPGNGGPGNGANG